MLASLDSAYKWSPKAMGSEAPKCVSNCLPMPKSAEAHYLIMFQTGDSDILVLVGRVKISTILSLN
jgi:hypothetical protein